MATIATREPEIFAAGDSLLFDKSLPGYLPADGWSLEYVLTAADGTVQLSLTSAANGAAHRISANAFAAALDSGTYILEGYVINGDERHRIYHGGLTLQDNLPAGLPAAAVKTEAQEMLEILGTQLKALYKQAFAETDVQRNKFVMQKQSEVRKEWQFWTAKRQNELQVERARNGQSPGNTQEAVFCIG